jgi:hypothetical protein
MSVDIRAPFIRQEHMVSARKKINFIFEEWGNRGGPILWKITVRFFHERPFYTRRTCRKTAARFFLS